MKMNFTTNFRLNLTEGKKFKFQLISKTLKERI
jgi:hypothetical protein